MSRAAGRALPKARFRAAGRIGREGEAVSQLVVLDGTRFESGGQALRTALSLSALTGIGFEARQLGLLD